MSENDATPAIRSGEWPVPVGLPLYVSVAEAAKLAGIGRDLMYEYVNNRADPIPQMRVGRSKTLIRTSAIPEYLRRRETA